VSSTYFKAQGSPGRVSGSYSITVQDQGRLRDYAAREDITMSQVVRAALRLYLTVNGAPEAAPAD
jgi:hypothetical protein